MSVTPEYELSLRLDALSDIIADCAIWQALVDDPDPLDWATLKAASEAAAGTAEAAKARISWREADERDLAEPDGSRTYDPAFWPRIILQDVRDNATKGAAFSWNGTAEFEMLVEIPVPAAYKGREAHQDRVTYHTNAIGLFRAQLLNQSQGQQQIQTIGFEEIGQYAPEDVGGYLILMCKFSLALGIWTGVTP